MKRKLISILSLLVAALLLSGCVKDGYTIFKEECPEDWTRREVEAAYDAFLKEFFMVKNADGTYSVDRTKVSVGDTLNVVNGILGDLDYVLTNDDWGRLLYELPTQRQAFLREEQRWTYIRNQLGEVKVYYDFLSMLGARVTDEDRKYSIRYLLPKNTEFTWTADYVESARADGKLREVERFLTYLYTPYGEKKPDPANPDDPKAFVWEPKLQAFLIVSYAILNSQQPQSLKADYVEVWRADIEGDVVRTESQPCARAFRKLSGHTLQILLLDWDHEGEAGYGVPDEVRSIYAPTGGGIYDRYTDIFEKLAQPRHEAETGDRDYTLPELDLQIVPVGKTEEYRGDYNPDGWSVPYEYRDEYGLNYVAGIQAAELPNDYPWTQVEAVVLKWADGAVWEYWTPVEALTGDLESCYAAGRNITYQPKGGSQATVSATALCGRLYAIVYREGEEWVKLYDADGTGKLQYRMVGVSDPATARVEAAKRPASSFEGNI